MSASGANDNTLAVQLKEAGNALFVAKKYQAAYKKYSEAINADGNSAVLYANRAACSQFLKKFLDAASDAKKSLGNNQSCVDTWQKALQALPIENLTAAELKQKETYELELKSAKSKLHTVQNTVLRGTSVKSGQAPWQLAIQLEDDLLSRGPDAFKSSAMVIAGAYGDWQDGEKKMRMQRVLQSPQGPMMMGFTGALELFTNAILRDDRIFHMSSADWLDMYNKQVMIEAQQVDAWVDLGPKQMMIEAVKRQRAQGWEITRPALTVTIRSWIMRGFMEQTMLQRNEIGVEFIGRALEVLRWGVEKWKDVPQEQKGAIFVITFIRGVHSIYLETYMKAHLSQPRKFSLETLFKEAKDLLDSLDVPVIPNEDPGFIMSFNMYPKGRAFSMIGFYHVQKVTQLFAQKGDIPALLTHRRAAADAYLQASQCYPEDDEMHIWFLKCAFESYCLCSTPLTVTLPLMEKIRLAFPNVMKIWQSSALSLQGGSIVYQKTMATETVCRERLAAGKLTMDSCFVPDELKSQMPLW
ncbi:hypothetical protein EUX98_g5763 [Antrodiella citrinella]|uniref:Uncharacterized protein n=1 Tax=Antrodiella citrinella TaxID=2447956 RepID=A0A4S4MQU4_9APHY|nr:hypothetical protein EUX98_g5763 [Antrodiella citrinella]